MTSHKSAEKRVRQTKVRNESNKYYAKTARNSITVLREAKSKEEAVTMLPKVSAMLDKLAKKNIIHANKAANLKSSLAKHVNSLS